MFVSFLIFFFTIIDIRGLLFAQQLNYDDCGVMPFPPGSSGPWPSTSSGGGHHHHPNILISGGSSAEQNSNLFPWMARVARASPLPGQTGFCGASILGNRWLLTARHCVNEYARVFDYARIAVEPYYMVGVGSPNLTELDWRHLVQKVYEYPIWKSWSFLGLDFDIALLELHEGGHLEFSEKVRKICLPMCYPIENGKKATLMGWGDQFWDGDGEFFPLEERPTKPEMLRYGTIELGRWRECYGRNPWFFCGVGNSSEMLWTLTGGGDSGGPVVVKTAHPNDPDMVIYYQIGVVSTGMDFDLEKFEKFGKTNVRYLKLQYRHSTYMAIDHFCEWIRITTKEEVKCQKIQGLQI